MIVTSDYRVDQHDTTAPIVAVTLAEKVDLVERFALTPAVLADWQVIIDPDLDGWVLRWHYLRLTIGDRRSDLDHAIAIAGERDAARRHVTQATAHARIALGWPPHATPTIRCATCLTRSPVTMAHTPGAPECHEDALERLWSQSS